MIALDVNSICIKAERMLNNLVLQTTLAFVIQRTNFELRLLVLHRNTCPRYGFLEIRLGVSAETGTRVDQNVYHTLGKDYETL